MEDSRSQEDPWEIGGYRWGGGPRRSKSRKKSQENLKNHEKIRKIRK